LVVPAVGVGAWNFGSQEGDYWGKRDQETTNAIVAEALRHGPALFDCAEMYQNGRAEESLGLALKAAGPELAANAVVATKIHPAHCSQLGKPGAVRAALMASLARLQLPKVALYQVHWPLSCARTAPSAEETFREFKQLQAEGLIEHIGVSNFGVKNLTEALATGVTIATNQVMYNPVSRAVEFEVMELCQQHGIKVICYSPLMQGLLTDKGVDISFDEMNPNRTRTRQFSGAREQSRHGGPGAEPQLRAALTKLGEIARREGVNVATLCMAWCLANPTVLTVIPGASSLEQLQGNLEAATLELKPEVKAEMDVATEELKQALGPHIDYYQAVTDQRSS